MTVETPEKTFACMTLLFMRRDQDRSHGMAYWRGPHAQLVARAPGRREYRQHHFAAQGGGWWPAPPSIETEPPADRRVDGIPEVTFTSPVGPLRGRAANQRIKADEANVFDRTLLYMTGFQGARWWRGSPTPQSRSVVLLRRAPQVSTRQFATFIDDLAARLNRRPELTELRTLTFRPWRQNLWDTPGVQHDNPQDQQFHAALVLGAESLAVVRQAVGAAVAGWDESQSENLAAAHAYDVELTLTYRDGDRPTLPRTADTPRDILRHPKLAPLRRTMPTPPARSREPRSVTEFPAFSTLDLPGSSPEDVILDLEENLLTGLGDGRIVRVDPETGRSTTVADTGGRPLGLQLLPDGRVLVCDAHRGLLRVDPGTGRVETLVEHVRGVPLRFCSNAAVEPDGTIWFTESTSRFDFETFLGSFLEHRPSGRLFRRDVSGDVEVVLQDLYFANGVTLVPDKSALLFAETSGARVSRLPLSGPYAGHAQIVADNLPGYPDNLSVFADGRTWTGMTTPRDAQFEKLGRLPGAVAKAIWALPESLRPAGGRTTWVMAFDESGTVVADLQTQDTPVTTVTGAVERRGELFCVTTGAASILRVGAPLAGG